MEGERASRETTQARERRGEPQQGDLAGVTIRLWDLEARRQADRANGEEVKQSREKGGHQEGNPMDWEARATARVSE